MTALIVAFGEAMARFSPPGMSRLRQALPGSLDVTFAGAEANIAASIALLGGRSRFITALPTENPLADACVGFLRGLGVDTSAILRSSEGRMPIYFLENGANQLPGRVYYDRSASTFSLTEGSAYDWHAALNGAAWLVLSGISPALSETAAQATLTAAVEAKKRGVSICCDLNFRAKLWQWEKGTPARDLARRVMADILPHVDLVITNAEQAHDVLGIPWQYPGAHASKIGLDPFKQALQTVAAKFPHLQRIIFTLRESHSASHNALGALSLDPSDGTFLAAPGSVEDFRLHHVHHMVDRVGGGDAFLAAYLFALTTPGLDDPALALAYGTAASCLAHSVPGDVNFASREDIESLVRGDGAGRVVR